MLNYWTRKNVNFCCCSIFEQFLEIVARSPFLWEDSSRTVTGLLHKPKNSARQWASKEQAASLLGADTFCQRNLATSLLNRMVRLMRCIPDWKHLIAIIFITSTFKLHHPIPSHPSLPTPIRPGSWQTLYTCWKIPHHFIRALYSLLLLPQPLLAAFFKAQRRSISLITVFFMTLMSASLNP